MRFARWGVLVGVVVLVGCGPVISGTPSDQPPVSVNFTVGEEFALGVGSTAHLDGGRVSVLFREVTEDSRCPVDVTCVWAGDATVALTVTADSVVAEHDLHVNVDPKAVDVAGYRVQLIGLDPERSWDHPQSDYRARLRVSGIGR